ncbi:Fibroblast growth factor 17 [Orchesella cincta]|uniref:Fibroblast growth factor 17 n=1 Tax=Orchesella cincta TaxID=48709 RepID=A0A1D2MB04_ORCCI|nr:Fibroblast growth factor 17 [Orchesella cincta]
MIVEGKPTQTLVSGSYNTTTAPIPPSSLAENSVQKVLSRAYRLYNFCSDRHVAIKNDGPPVSATAGKNDQNGELVLETMMKRGALRIRIRGFYSNKYMCYNRKGRLVAKPKVCDKFNIHLFYYQRVI